MVIATRRVWTTAGSSSGMEVEEGSVGGGESGGASGVDGDGGEMEDVAAEGWRHQNV